jgi:hypothetical protein
MNFRNDITVGEAQNLVEIMEERQIRLNKMFGITHNVRLEPGKHGLCRVTQGSPYPDASRYRPFQSLREAYIEFSGDADIRYFGKGLRAIQVAGLPTFENALANVCNRLLLKDFATNYRWSDIATSITSPPDFRPNTRTRLRYTADIPDLTEDQPYTEVQTGAKDYDETLTYSINQKACEIAFTHRVLLNDDIGVIQRAVEQLGRAAWRTLSKRIWNLLISNATYGVDGVAMFHANHANTGVAALSAAALTTARNAIFAQTESNSTDRLGLGGGPLLLAVPIQLEATALGINKVEYLDAAFTPNPWRYRFGRQDENIFANPLFTDANDWYLLDVGSNVEIIEVGFLMGSQNPQVIESAPEQTDSAFYQDRVTYRLRHEYECVISDFRGAFKSIVT